jgi:hypothetical protein
LAAGPELVLVSLIGVSFTLMYIDFHVKSKAHLNLYVNVCRNTASNERSDTAVRERVERDFISRHHVVQVYTLGRQAARPLIAVVAGVNVLERVANQARPTHHPEIVALVATITNLTCAYQQLFPLP